MSIIKSTTFLIIGGGIAGISCIETLQYQIESSKNKIEINQQQQHEQPQPQPQQQIILLTESPLIKSVTNLVPLGKALTRFDIEEKCAKNKFHNSITVEIIIDQLDEINTELKYAITKASGTKINYQLLCLCTGARPKLIESIPDDCRSFVLGIRDTESVRQLQKRIQSNSRRIAIIGNGGIASEIVYELKNIEIMWIIKDRFISQTFIDPGAAEFFQNKLNENGGEGKTTSKEITANSQSIIKRMRYLEEETETEEDSESVKLLTKNGAALGPDWHRLINFNRSSSSNDRKTTEKFIKIYNNCEIKSMKLNENYQRLNSNSNSNSEYNENNFPLIIELTNLENEKIYCDFLISATGVQPTINFKLNQKSAFAISPTDGGILIDKWMRTSIPNIFAAGDVCTANWMKSEHWFQMRLWTQARQMGSMAGKSMWAVYQQQIQSDSDSELELEWELELKLEQDFSFELFGHVTQLYGYQVVLLGKFNGQGLMKKMMSNDVATDEDCQDCEIILRMTANKEYIKYILVGGKLKGAILIGDTGLEETTENLILNQLDLRAYGDDILNPDIDIEDYFD